MMNDFTPLLIALIVIPALILYVWVGLSLQALFRKAGEPSWAAWVPFLNHAVLLRLGGLSPWLILLLLVPVLGQIAFIVVSIVAYNRVNNSFGFGAGMTVLAVLLFPVWTSILGWGSARWLSADAPSSTGPLRRSGEAPPLETRVSTPPPAPAGPSVFGTHGPAGGPAVPPRPPAPSVAGYPSVIPEPVAAYDHPARPLYGVSDVDIDLEASAPSPVPAFRSTMRRAEGQAVLDESAFTGRAPYTETTPTQSDGGSAPAGPIRAFPAQEDGDTGGFQPVDVVPVSAMPPAPARAGGNPWAPPTNPLPPVATRARLPVPEGADAHYETSAEVSAVAGAPTLGAPRSARTSVSAQHTEPEIPDDAAFDETIVTSRRRTQWSLVPPLGAPIAITSDVVILGRRPNFDADFADAQLVPVSDETRTVSKTHARLELQGDGWVVVDLDSTNGVILISADGDEIDATPGVPEKLTERFLLGDAELQVRREGE